MCPLALVGVVLSNGCQLNVPTLQLNQKINRKHPTHLSVLYFVCICSVACDSRMFILDCPLKDIQNYNVTYRKETDFGRHLVCTLWVSWSQRLLNYLASFVFLLSVHIIKLFQKHVVRTKFDTYVFITITWSMLVLVDLSSRLASYMVFVSALIWITEFFPGWHHTWYLLRHWYGLLSSLPVFSGFVQLDL